MAQLSKPNGTNLFIQEMVSSPRQVGAIAPSSRKLAAVMAESLPRDYQEYVLELGPGSGVVTQALLDRGLPPNRLIAIEKSPRLAEHLRHKFPSAHILEGDALEMQALIKNLAPHALPFTFIFSGLPLLNFEPSTALRLADILRKSLKPEGRLIQFSYSLRPKRSRSFFNFNYLDSTLVWQNLPPARVSVYAP